MKRFTLAAALGTGLTLGLAAPAANAAPTTIQSLSTQSLSASAFNADFTPYNSAQSSPFQFAGGPVDASGNPVNAGMIESQVFKGTGAFSGLYAYAYQVSVNPLNDATGNPVYVDSTSYRFNATPVAVDVNGAGQKAYGAVITGGSVGGLTLPGSQTPTSLTWQPGQNTGYVRAQYTDPSSQTQPVTGANSATFVLFSTALPSPTSPTVNVGSGVATTTVPVAYSASGGPIGPVPVPEPATVLAWAGMAGAVALVRRHRRNRPTLA
jgi:hypothetical protein